MVIGRQRQRGWLMTDFMVATAILMLAVVPVGVSILHDMKEARLFYWRGVAMELVDGEMEVLRAGEWRAFEPGTHDYPVGGPAADNLPDGSFTLIVAEGRIELKWQPAKRGQGGPVVRVWNPPKEDSP